LNEIVLVLHLLIGINQLLACSYILVVNLVQKLHLMLHIRLIHWKVTFHHWNLWRYISMVYVVAIINHSAKFMLLIIELELLCW